MFRYGLFVLCVILMPIMAGGNADNRGVLDANKYGDEPHRYVLKMMNNGRVTCTANLVNGKIVTAKHCLNDFKNLRANCADDNTVYTFQTLDGSEIKAKVTSCGGYKNTLDTLSGDWAVLDPEVHTSELHFADGCERDGGVVNDDEGIMTGYGKLKVLKDADVTGFVHSYLRFLFDAQMGFPVGTSKDADVDELAERVEALDKGVQDVRSEGTNCSRDFLNSASYYGINVDEWFDDSNPKTRECGVSSCDTSMCELDCNAWQGDSGAGFWKKVADGKYCFGGVLSQAADDIGGGNSVARGSVYIVLY